MKNRKEILIVGAGIAGLTAARELGRRGIACFVIEKEESIGGHAALYTCKAVNGECQKCGACLVQDAIRDIREIEGIEISRETSLLAVDREGEEIVARLKTGQRERTARFSAILLCHGFQPFDPEKKPNLRYGDISNLITGLDLEQMMKERGNVFRPSDGVTPKDMAFIQCVGSRNPALGKPYCSQVCCGYALRMARKIKVKNPSLNVTFFYMDVQTFGRDFEKMMWEYRDAVYWIREIPGDFFRVAGERVGVMVEDEGEIEEMAFDLMVLSVGMGPSPDQAVFEKWLELPIGPEGFVVSPDQRGVFAAGSATGPMSIPDTVSSARATVTRLMHYLEESA